MRLYRCHPVIGLQTGECYQHIHYPERPQVLHLLPLSHVVLSYVPLVDQSNTDRPLVKTTYMPAIGPYHRDNLAVCGRFSMLLEQSLGTFF
jgi:hypothetical protein